MSRLKKLADYGDLKEAEIVDVFLKDLGNVIKNSTDDDYNELYEMYYLAENDFDKNLKLVNFYLNRFDKNRFESNMPDFSRKKIQDDEVNDVKDIISNYDVFTDKNIFDMFEKDIQDALLRLE